MAISLRQLEYFAGYLWAKELWGRMKTGQRFLAREWVPPVRMRLRRFASPISTGGTGSIMTRRASAEKTVRGR
jgi:hypothetical protein